MGFNSGFKGLIRHKENNSCLCGSVPILRNQLWGINSIMRGCSLLGFSVTLRNPEFRHHVQKRPSEPNNPSTRLPLPFDTRQFSWWQVHSSCATKKMDAQPLSAHRHCLRVFNMLITNLHLYTSLPPPEPPDLPFRLTRFTVNMGKFGYCRNR